MFFFVLTETTFETDLIVLPKPKVDKKDSNNNNKSNSSKASAAVKQWKDKINGRTLKKEQREQAAKIRIEEMEKQGKETSLNKSLISYLEMCVFTEQINRGLNTLNYYRSRNKSSNQYPKITAITAYNILLQGFASKVSCR